MSEQQLLYFRQIDKVVHTIHVNSILRIGRATDGHCTMVVYRMAVVLDHVLLCANLIYNE